MYRLTSVRALLTQKTSSQMGRFAGVRAFSTADGDDKGYVESRSELPYNVFPTIAKRGSYKLDLVKGESYYYCTCGNS